MTENYKHIQCVGIVLYQHDGKCQTEVHPGIPATNLSEDIIELDALINTEPCLSLSIRECKV